MKIDRVGRMVVTSGPAAVSGASMRRPFTSLFRIVFALALLVPVSLLATSPVAAVTTIAPTTTCGVGLGDLGGRGLICEVTVVNTITASGGTATVTVRECLGSAGAPTDGSGGAGFACTTKTATLTQPVTVAVPPLAVMVLTTVTSQIRPLPPRSPRPTPQVVVGAIVVAAATGEVARSDTGTKRARANTIRKREVNGRRMEAPLTAAGPEVTTIRPTRSIFIAHSLQASGERLIEFHRKRVFATAIHYDSRPDLAPAARMKTHLYAQDGRRLLGLD